MHQERFVDVAKNSDQRLGRLRVVGALRECSGAADHRHSQRIKAFALEMEGPFLG